MSSTYFISDLHLDSARPSTSRAFFRFLEDIAACDRLYILGDLFEAWAGDDDDSDLARDVTAALAKFNASDARTWLMHGNRDFLIGDRFSSESGVQLLDDPSIVSLYGNQVLLMHGDSLCTDDIEYQEFRALVRGTKWQAEALSLTLDERRDMARKLRQQSLEAKSNKAEDIVDVTPAAVESALQGHAVERLIHGHTHRPGHFQMNSGQRWVLGDWEHSPTILKVNSKEWALEEIDY